MGKGKYRAISVKSVNVEKLASSLGERAVIGIDVAKEKQYASLFDPDTKEVAQTVHWEHPADTREFYGLCAKLVAQGIQLEVAMEASGTYGDALRVGLLNRGMPVFQVAGSRVSSARSIQDGVPSLHDAKSAHLIAWLHNEGSSTSWPLAEERQREMAAASDAVAWWMQWEQQQIGRLEAKLARHWPELTSELSLTSATLAELLATYGGPAAVASAPDEARALMRRVGRNFLADDTVEAVLESARGTLGVPMTPTEREVLRELAAEMRRASQQRNTAEKRLLELSRDDVPAEAAKLVGGPTAAMMLANGVDPAKYDSAGAFLKAVGLNLRVKSSGKDAGSFHISKGGSGEVRQLLYLFALRQIQWDQWTRAWYLKKRGRDGQGKSAPKAVVAVMRKLVKALWHVWTKKQVFDSTRLFDVSRLDEKARPAAKRQAS